MIDLTQLIKIAPFSDEIKKQLLERVSTIEDDEKFKLVQGCWGLIAESYRQKIDFEMQRVALQAVKDNKPLDKKVFLEIEEKYFKELVNKLGGVETQEEINEVRERLTVEVEKSLGTTTPTSNPQ
jgi:hypothetical protein